MNFAIIAWIVSVLGGGSPIVVALNNEQIETAKIIYYHAQEYDIDKDKFLRLAACESGLRQEAIGDNGLARGLYQYHKKTWDAMTKKYGNGLRRENVTDQIFLTANIISKEENGINNWWNCGKKIAYF